MCPAWNIGTGYLLVAAETAGRGATEHALGSPQAREVIMDIREKAKALLDSNVPENKEIWSDRDASEFKRLTGKSHAELVAVWSRGSKETMCYGFAQWYSIQLGSRVSLGVLQRPVLLARLKSVGKLSAWVESTRDTRPKYGDICLHKAMHIGVHIGFDAAGVRTQAAAGQGGPPTRDIVKRARGKVPYDFTKMHGWVDLDLYFDATP